MAFGFLAVACIVFKMRWLSAGAPGGTVGTDVGIIALGTVRRGWFWAVFLVALAAGSELAHYDHGLSPYRGASRRIKPTLRWVIMGTVIWLTTFILGSFAYLIMGHVINSGSPMLWAAFLGSMAFGYYVARSSNQYVWILKGAFMGFVALFPVSAFYLILRESLAESTRIDRTPHEPAVASPLFWSVLAVTVLWAFYAAKPSKRATRSPDDGSLFGRA